MKDSIQEALKTIAELETLYDSENVVVINQLCNKLINLSVHIGKQTTDAEKLFKSLKDEYEYVVDKKKLELIESGVGVGKAESTATVEFYEKKKDYRTAEDGFERLKRFLQRLDKVFDSNKQYVATIKSTNLKGV